MATTPIPTISEIRQLSLDVLGARPCLWQIKVVQAILRGKNMVSIAGTGMGKILTFWLPLLFRPKCSVQIIVTPLNILGKQNDNSLKKAGLLGIFISAENATPENFRDIESLKYQAVIINPAFTNNLVNTIFDEAHCISGWSTFRPDYALVGRIRKLFPKNIPIMLASATLPVLVLHDVLRILGMAKKDFEFVRKSCDRHNVGIYVRPINKPLSSFADLEFLLCNWKPGDPPPPKFIVFCDNIADSVKACEHLRSLLPIEYRSKIKWFNSEMSYTFREHEVNDLTSAESWGDIATETLGMGMDIPNVRVIVQWRATCTMTVMWQRFGRAGRKRSIKATAILLVEKEYFDEEKEKKEAQKQKRASKKPKPPAFAPPPSKRRRLEELNQSVTTTHPNADTQGDNENTANNTDSESGSDHEVSLHEKYIVKAPSKEKKKRKARNIRDIEPAMDDLLMPKVVG